jgi:hypothetical protein
MSESWEAWGQRSSISLTVRRKNWLSDSDSSTDGQLDVEELALNRLHVLPVHVPLGASTHHLTIN